MISKEKTKIFLKPQSSALVKSNSVVRVHRDKIENEYNLLEAKVGSFFKNFSEMEIRSKERQSKIENLLMSQRNSIEKSKPPQQIYHKARIKYINHSDKGSAKIATYLHI